MGVTLGNLRGADYLSSHTNTEMLAGRRFSHQLTNLLELRRRRRFAPFEKSGLRRCKSRAGCLHAPQRGLVINFRSRSDRVDGYVNAPAVGHEIQRRLLNADVRLNPAQQQFFNPLVAKSCEDSRQFAATETPLWMALRKQHG